MSSSKPFLPALSWTTAQITPLFPFTLGIYFVSALYQVTYLDLGFHCFLSHPGLCPFSKKANQISQMVSEEEYMTGNFETWAL